MKNYIIIAICIINMLNAITKIKANHTPREWDPTLYEQGNNLQTNSFFDLLEKNQINLKGCKILSIGCGTGKIESKIPNVECIDGIDASQNMINYAKEHYGHAAPHLSFSYCFAEDFHTKTNYYDRAIASFSLHWIENKKQAIQCISNALKTNGEFFAIFQTRDNGIPRNLAAFIELYPTIQEKISIITQKNLPPLNETPLSSIIGSSYPSIEEFNNMLENAGFEIIKNEEQTYESKMTKEEIKNLQLPIFSSRPCFQDITEELKEIIFNLFIDQYIEGLEKSENNTFKEIHHTTVLHARKIK